MDELVAEAEVIFENGLGLLAVGPDLVLGAAAVGAEVWLEGSVLEPADVELGVVGVVADFGSGVGGVDEGRVRELVKAGRYCQPPMSVLQ